jgi:hypothetical protein
MTWLTILTSAIKLLIAITDLLNKSAMITAKEDGIRQQQAKDLAEAMTTLVKANAISNHIRVMTADELEQAREDSKWYRD